MMRACFEEEVRIEALAYDGPKDGLGDGFRFFLKLMKRRTDLAD